MDKDNPTENPGCFGQNPVKIKPGKIKRLGEIKSGEIKFFGRRHGPRLTDKKQQLLQQVLPDLTVDLSQDHIDLAKIFGEAKKEYWLEIGFGSGEHLVWQAQHHPDVGMIGCEPFINGVARLLVYLEHEKPSNIRIHPDDARQVMDKLPDACLAKIFLLFPDTWPKYKHRLRRFVGPHNLPKFERLLQGGGELRVATDHRPYLRWVLMYLMGSEKLEWIDEGPKDWYNRRADWPATRYEQKALAGNPHYLRFVRKAC